MELYFWLMKLSFVRMNYIMGHLRYCMCFDNNYCLENMGKEGFIDFLTVRLNGLYKCKRTQIFLLTVPQTASSCVLSGAAL